jgi:O-antigen ligase
MITKMKTKQINSTNISRLNVSTKWIIWGTFSVSIYFNSKLMDPFNSPKFWILMFISAWLLGHICYDLIFNKKNSHIPIPKPLKFFLTTFIFSMFISSLLTDDKYTAFFGENLRRNGFLTYLSLVVIFIASIKYASLNFVNRFLNMAIILSSILVMYAFLQYSGNDFIDWNNPYNSVILTVGNPNFSSALLAILFLLILTKLLVTRKLNFVFYMIAILLALLVLSINLTSSRQGLVSLGFAIATLVTIFSFNYSKWVGILVLILSSTLSAISILGMLQIGPLTQLLYKPSVTVRGYYWRAAIQMFYDKPLFGVGIDSFGSFFKQYREVGYPLTYGFNITSTNAHNLPLQFLSTGGFFVGLSYLLINLYVVIVAISKIFKVSGVNQKLLIGLFTSWIAYQAQTFISIDNIGLSIWGWVMAGLIIGICKEENALFTMREKSINEIIVKRLVISTFLSFIILIGVVNLYRNETNMLKQQALANSIPSNEANRQNFLEQAKNTIEGKFVEPRFKVLTALNYLYNNELDSAIPILLEEEKRDPRNLEVKNMLAATFTQKRDFEKAISYRKDISLLDKFNANNYLELGRLYKLSENYPKMQEVKEIILKISSSIEEAKLAKTELVK